jgi:hypothetical protein
MNYIIVYVLVEYSYFAHGAAALTAHHDCVIAIVIYGCMQAAPLDPVSEAR